MALLALVAVSIYNDGLYNLSRACVMGNGGGTLKRTKIEKELVSMTLCD